MSTKGQKTDQQLAELEAKEAEPMPKGQEGIFVGKRTGLHCAVAVDEDERHSVVSDPLQPRRLYSPWDSPGQNTGVASLSLLQGIFPTQGSNPGLPHCRRRLPGCVFIRVHPQRGHFHLGKLRGI